MGTNKERVTDSRRRVAGTTVLEAMMTVAIAATLATLCVPGLVEFVRDTRRDNEVMDVAASLGLARSEAIKRQRRVTVCPSEDGSTCNGDAGWESGWIVFEDTNANNAVNEGEPIIRIREHLGAGTTVRGGRERISYRSDGFTPGYNDTLRVCDSRGRPKARSVVIANSGRVRVEAGADSCP